MTAHVHYFGTDTSVELGDHIVIRRWLRKIPARITYVPGISTKNADMEFNGLTWVCVQIPGGTRFGVVVNPENNELKNNVTFVKRGKADIKLIDSSEKVFE